jgi:TRAP-type mannitol/chloroaromatic compound transport system permease large subunit
MGDIFRAVTPFVLMSLLMLVLIFNWPGIATWLPKFLA